MSVKSPTRRRARPFIFVNVAMTADGKIAFYDGRFDPFGSAYDREHLLELRAQADAVMSGAGTVGDHPVTLGPGPARFRRLRLHRGLAEYNLRVVVSGRASVSPTAEIFRHHYSPIILLTTRSAAKSQLAALEKAGAHICVCGEKEVNFRRAALYLAQRWNVHSLLCEGGGMVNDGLFRAGLVDELHLTLCPYVFGGRTAPTLMDGRGHSTLINANQLVLKSQQRIGNELYLVYRRGP